MARNNTAANTGKQGRSELVRFGNTDIYVSRICQGTAFANMPRSPDNQVGLRVLRHCLDVGLNFFDAATGYGMGGSQKLLGKAVAGRRDQAVISVKMNRYGIPVDAKEGDIAELGQYDRDFIFGETDRSLKRLDTDYIDFLLIVDPDGVTGGLKHAQPERLEVFLRRYEDGAAPTPPEEIVDTMDALVQAGKIRYWGVSKRPTKDVAEFVEICERTGKAPISCLQYGYDLLRDRVTEGLFRLIRRTGVGVQIFSPLAKGQLVPGRVAEHGSALADLLDVLDGVAGDLGVPRSQVCIAWVLSHPELTTALGGAESPEHVDDNMAASMLRLPVEAILAMNAASDVYKVRQEAEGRA